MDKWQAQQDFWESFGIPAYDEQTEFTEGDLPAYPHIRYQSFGGYLGQTATLSASLWYRTSNWKDIKEKASEIERYIRENTPIAIPIDPHGYLWIKVPVSIPFAQPGSSGSKDEKIKRIVLTVEAECLTAF